MLKNISYSFFANVVSFLVSVIMVMFIPKFLPLESYGTWQLFLFYFSYLGFFHFGWEDGLYLRYAGLKYGSLDKRMFSGQLYGIIVLQIMVAVVAVAIASLFVTDPIKLNVLYCVAPLVIFVNFNNACNQIMQFTNRIKDYTALLLLERLLLLIFVFLGLILGFHNFQGVYIAKVLSVSFTFFFSIYLCRDLLAPKFYPMAEVVQEAIYNIVAGIKLMFANIASMLIIGIVRYGVSVGWDVVTFGKVSLTLGISNFLMIFINAVSVAFFPMLKHVEESRLADLYLKLRSGLSIILLALLLFYYPIRCLLSWWLPQYEDSLVYMAVLFPVCIFESKMQLLVNTYLKSMRQEFLMLKINSIAVILSAIVTVVSVELFHNLDMTIFSIVFLYAIRCFYAEVKLQKLLGLHLGKDMVMECLLVCTFIAGGWIWDNFICMVIYGVAYMAYLAWNKKQITNLILKIKSI